MLQRLFLPKNQMHAHFFLVAWNRHGITGYLKHVDFLQDEWVENPLEATPFFSRIVSYIAAYYTGENSPGEFYLQEVETNLLEKGEGLIKATGLVGELRIA